MTREQTFEKLHRMKLHGFAHALEEDLCRHSASPALPWSSKRNFTCKM